MVWFFFTRITSPKTFLGQSQKNHMQKTVLSLLSNNLALCWAANVFVIFMLFFLLLFNFFSFCCCYIYILKRCLKRKTIFKCFFFHPKCESAGFWCIMEVWRFFENVVCFLFLIKVKKKEVAMAAIFNLFDFADVHPGIIPKSFIKTHHVFQEIFCWQRC